MTEPLVPAAVHKANWLRQSARHAVATGGNAPRALAGAQLHLAVIDERLVIAVAHDSGCPVVEAGATLELCHCELLTLCSVPREKGDDHA